MRPGQDDQIGIIRAVVEKKIPFCQKATGESMLPTIPNGATVHLIPTDGRTPNLGDIVLSISPRMQLTLHRVSILWRKNGRIFCQTWGDNNSIPDPLVPPDQVLAKVIRICHQGSDMPLISSNKAFFYFFLKKYFWHYFRYFLKRISPSQKINLSSP